MDHGLKQNWTLMASHGVVLFYIAANPNSTMREMAEALELTERRIVRIVRDLSDADMLEVIKKGRRNVYSVNEDATFSHPTLSHVKLSSIVEALASAREKAQAEPQPAPHPADAEIAVRAG
jgi:DNA-binding transcriptional regulator GbsR (MarR family)